MLSKQIRTRILRYFISSRRWFKTAFIAGTLILILGAIYFTIPEFQSAVNEIIRKNIGANTNLEVPVFLTIILGISLISLSIFKSISNLFSIPSDRRIDKWYEIDRGSIFDRGLDKTGIHKTQLVGEKQVFIYGIVTDPNIEQYWRLGKDGIIRFSHTEITALYFIEDELLVYECIFDHTTGKALNEATHEFFYRFVAGVSIVNVSGQLRLHGRKNPIQWNNLKTFSLGISGIDPIRVTLGDLELIEELGGKMPPSDVDKAIASVRKMIRDKNITK